MTVSYEEARAELAMMADRLRDRDQEVFRVYSPDRLAVYLRAILAGPPEPSREEIARTIYPEAFLWGGDPTVALKAAAMVQALYRSRRA
jgi:hypothetical protein